MILVIIISIGKKVVNVKIAIDTRFIAYPDFACRGIGRYVTELINALQKENMLEKIVLWGQPLYGNKFQIIRDSIEFGNTRKKLFKRNIVHPLKVKLHKINLIHYLVFDHMPYHSFTKAVVTVLDLIQHTERGSENIMSERYLENSNAIISISENTKTEIVKKFGIQPGKVFVIYLGISDSIKKCGLERDVILKEKHNISAPYYLYVGGFDPRKNVPLLIEMFHEVVSNTKGNEKLVLVGRRSEKVDFNDINKTISKLNMESKIIFTGYVSDKELSILYSKAKLFLFPSSYEGFGFPPLEAMKCGTPVLVFNNSTMPELVRFKEFLIEDGNKEAFIKTWIDFDKNINDIKSNYSDKLIKQANAFSWDKTAKKTLEIYRHVLAI